MLITNFSFGELSRTLSGRVDLAQYYSGCSHLKNFDIIPTGGIKRRVGFERLSRLSGECRIIPFILDKDNSFILEFVPGKILIWKNGRKLLDAEGNQVEIQTEYQNMAEINEIQYAQNYDTLVFAQRKHKPFMLRYNFMFESFSGNEMNFDLWADVNLDDDYDYILIADEKGLPDYDPKHPYCVYNGKLYKYNEEEKEWQNNDDDPEVDEKLFDDVNKYPGCVTFNSGRLWFASTIESRQKVWASAAPDTEGTRYNQFTTYQKFITVNKAVKDADLHIFTADIKISDIDTEENTTTLTNVTQNLLEDGLLTSNLTEYYISNDNYIEPGTKLVSFAWNQTTKRGTLVINRAVNKDLLTKDVNGTVCTCQLWKTRTSTSDDYEFMVVSHNQTTSDCSFNFELASEQNDAVKFLGANKHLCIGTESAVWVVPQGVNAINIQAEMTGRYGSDDIQGHCVDTAMIFFAQGKSGIREYYYNSQTEAFQTNNIAIMAEHVLTESPAVDFDFMTNPYNRLIVTRADGIAVCLLYDKNNGVMGWTRYSHAEGKLRSCAVVRGDLQSDIIYYAVEDDGVFYLERVDVNQDVYLDSWQKYTEEMLNEYKLSAIIYNKSQNKIHNLSDGELPDGFFNTEDEVYIGYNYESKIISLPVLTQDPTAKKRIVNLLVRFLDSYMPVMECAHVKEYFTDVEEPYSGIRQIDYPGISDRDVTFTLSYSEPHRCMILSVNAVVA